MGELRGGGVERGVEWGKRVRKSKNSWWGKDYYGVVNGKRGVKERGYGEWVRKW